MWHETEEAIKVEGFDLSRPARALSFPRVSLLPQARHQEIPLSPRACTCTGLAVSKPASLVIYPLVTGRRRPTRCPLIRAPPSSERSNPRYLVQGNVRLVGARSLLGRMEARAVVRLLLREDDMTPVLYMETLYYATNPDPGLGLQVMH